MTASKQWRKWFGGRNARGMVKPGGPSTSWGLRLEALEDRTVPSLTATVGANVNISQRAANQHESTIVINPTNVQNLFAASNNEGGGGNFAAFSTDGGATWTGRLLGTGTGPGGDGLPAGGGDVQAAFDPFGNLYLTYLSGPAATRVATVVLSTDGGQTFTNLVSFNTTAGFTTALDQPSIATGARSVWVSYRGNNNSIVAAGANVTGLGAANIGTFASQTLQGSAGGNFGDIAVGPNGQVLVTYQTGGGAGPGTIFVNLDADGVGPATFGNAVQVTTTQVGGTRNIPAQSNSAGIDAEANLAWDRSGGARNGRVYLVYTDAPNTTSNATKTFVRYSDNNGANWTNPIGVFDNAANNNSQFLPSISVDQTNGNVGVAWHDARNDLGTGGPGDTNGTANDDAQLFAAFSDDGGNNFSANRQISRGTSNSAASEPAGAGFRNLGYGDYQKSDFFGGVFYRVWADNSNSTGNNPAGALGTMEIYTAKVTLSSQPVSGFAQMGVKVTTGYQSDNGPALVSHSGALYLAHAGLDSNLYLDFLSPAKANFGPTFPTGERTNDLPALATFNNQLFVAWTGTDDHINVAVVTTAPDGSPTGLTQKVTLGYESDFGPALVAHAGALYLVHTGMDEHLYLDFISATKPNWGPSAFDTGEESENPAALAASNNQLFLGWTGTDDHLNVAAVSTGPNGAPIGLNQKATLGYESDVGPSLVFHDGALFLSHAGKDENLYLDFVSSAKPNWGPNAFPTGELTESPPPLASHSGRLFVGWTGTDDHVNIRAVELLHSNRSGLQALPVVNGVVTVNGDQLGLNDNDTIVVGRSAAGGVQITLNGQVAEYDPGSITGIVINTGGGSNTVIVESTFALAPMTINGNGMDRLAFSGPPPANPVYTPNADGQPANGTLNVGGLVIRFTGLAFVNQVAPRLTGIRLSAPAINENGDVTVTGDILDPGSLSGETVTVTWGDGVTDAPTRLPAGARSFTFTHRYRDDNPTGTASDPYTVSVTVTDNDNLSATATATVTVNNVVPQLANVTVTPEIDENGVVTLSGDIVDPGTQDTFTLVVDWGEGAPQSFSYPAGTTHFSETHQYLDDNPTGTPQDMYSIRQTLTDDDTGQATATASTLVKNVAPVFTALGTSSTSEGPAREGEPVTISGTFTDVGTLDTHIVTVDWGDGIVAPAALTEAGGSGSFSSLHAYQFGGIYPVLVTLRDDDTGEVARVKAVFITGVGVHVVGGLTSLQVIGTIGPDQVMINEQGNGVIKVHADFLRDGQRTLPSAGLDIIQVVTLAGDDLVTVGGSVDLPAVIDGGDGNDHLNNDGVGGVVIGGGGNDELIGGSSRDILIGGVGTDRLVGNGADDILIGGRTAYDSGADDDKLANDLRLLKLLDEWKSPRTFTERIANLRAGAGPVLAGTGLSLANGVTVFDDFAADVLTGSAGMDWLFLGVGDTSSGGEQNN